MLLLAITLYSKVGENPFLVKIHVNIKVECVGYLCQYLKEHAVPPCLVLVIDDNLYGLRVALSYI